jgi:Concanavalin A-like lectin/glucanases superfamily/FecR protein
MSTVLPEDTDDWTLALLLLGEELTPEEDVALAKRLEEDEPFAKRAMHLTRVEQSLRLQATSREDEVIASVLASWQHSSSQTASPAKPSRGGQGVLWKLVALGAGIAFLLMVALWPSATSGQLRIVESNGQVFVQRGGREWQAIRGELFKPGDALWTRESGTVSLEWPGRDGSSTIHLRANTKAVFNENDSGKRIDLQQGELRAEVAKQPAGKPMMLHTPHGQAEVLGTTFVLNVQPDSTRLQVEHGRVLMAKDSVGQIVEANQTGVLSRSGTLDVAFKPVAESLQDGLFAHWPLDEVTDGMTPDRTGRYPARIQHVDVVAGRVGKATRFTNDMGIVQTPAVTLPDEFTLALWVKADDWNGHLRFLFANSLQKNETPGVRFFVNRIDVRSESDKTMHNNRTLHLETGNGEMWARTRSTPAVMKLSTWQHVTLTVDRPNGIAEMYVDGERVSETRGIRDDFKTHAPLTFGAVPDRWQSAIPGCLDDIRIYSRLLRHEEIRALAAPP